MKDRRYAGVKALLEAGQIKEISDLFDLVPKSIAYRKMGLGYNRFLACIDDPGSFTLKELTALAELIEVDGRVIIDLAYENMKRVRKKKK